MRVGELNRLARLPCFLPEALCSSKMGGSGTNARMMMAMMAGTTPTANRPRQPNAAMMGADQHAYLEAQADGGSGLRAVSGAGNLGGDGHAQAELGADAQARQEAEQRHQLEAGRESRAQGEHAEEDDRVSKHPDAAELVGQRAEDQAA